MWTALVAAAMLVSCAGTGPTREERELAASTHRAFRMYREWAEAPERDSRPEQEHARLGEAIDEALSEWERGLGEETPALREVMEAEGDIRREAGACR